MPNGAIFSRVPRSALASEARIFAAIFRAIHHISASVRILLGHGRHSTRESELPKRRVYDMAGYYFHRS